VPRFFTLYEQCIKYRVQDVLIRRMHYNDLSVLLMRLDIENIKQALRQQRQAKQKQRGIGEVKKLSASEAVNFLKGGI